MRIPASVRGLCGVSAALLVASAVWADEPKKVALDKSDEQQFSGWAYSADGKRVAAHWSKEQKGGIGVWDTATGKRLALIPVERSDVVSVGISPDGSLVAAAGRIGLFVWEVVTGKQTLSDETFVTTNDTPIPGRLAFSPDNKRIALGSDGSTAVWDLTAAKPKRIDMADCEEMNLVGGFSSDGKRIVGSTVSPSPVIIGRKKADARRVVVWDAATGKEVSRRSDVSRWFPSPTAFSPDGKWVTSGGGEEFQLNSTLQLWDVENGKTKAALELEGPVWVREVRFTPDGNGVLFTKLRLVSQQTGECSVGLWDPAAKTTRTIFGGKDAEITLDVGDSIPCWGLAGDSELLVILLPKPPVETPVTAPKPTVTTLLRAQIPTTKRK